ncbi:MAG: hypothetical protein AAB815_01255 [Patescibacteria group bacterium]
MKIEGMPQKGKIEGLAHDDYVERLKLMSNDELKKTYNEVAAYKEDSVRTARADVGSEIGLSKRLREARKIDSEAEMLEQMMKERGIDFKSTR